MRTSKVTTTEQFNNIIEFRQQVYERALVTERDAQFELVDALLLSQSIDTFPGRC